MAVNEEMNDPEQTSVIPLAAMRASIEGLYH
jgi:hypothetical protein